MRQQPTAPNGDERTPEEVFIARMKRERSRRGWSQHRLAKEVNAQIGRAGRRRDVTWQVHSTTITKLEYALQDERRHETRNLRLNEAVAIAEALDMALEQMLSDDDLDNRQKHIAMLYKELQDATAQVQQAHEDYGVARQRAQEIHNELGDLLRADNLRISIEDGGVVLSEDDRVADQLADLEEQDRRKVTRKAGRTVTRTAGRTVTPRKPRSDDGVDQEAP